ncbi:MAG: LD-carboxypeptidase, partial [Candidatus Falkowbacteria bacterium]|nr:LD-carboxypeptidase [Candidatus Falkowbacteria bacterium]
EGKASGTILGANLCTFNLLQGTEYFPSLKDSILFIEDDDTSLPYLFDRDLQSFIHLSDFKNVKGVVIGRFQKASKMTNEILTKIIKTKKELDNLPVVADFDFGHTNPLITFPIGGEASLEAKDGRVELFLLKH